MNNMPISEFANKKLQSAMKKSNEMIDKSSISHEEKVKFVSELLVKMLSLNPNEVEVMAKDDSLEKFILNFAEKKIGNS